MTVSTIDSAAEFVTNGVTTNYPFYFKFLANEDLVVTYVSPAGVSSVLTLGTQYTVNGAGNEQGGSVVTTTALAGPGQLIVSREMDAYQQTSLRNQGKFLAETHEDVFDRLTMLIQQGFAIFKRALTRPFGRDYFYGENRRIKSLLDPVDLQDAATKNWAQQYIASVLGTGQGPINNAANIYYAGPDGSPHTVQELSGSGGSALLGFLQAGLNAVPRTIESKLRDFVDLEDFGTVDKVGTAGAAAANTIVMNRAIPACNLMGKALRLPEGVMAVNPFSLPATFIGMHGRSKYGTTLKFNRQAYAANTVLLNAQNNTAGLELAKFSIDCDDAIFKVAGLAVLPLTGSNNWIVNDVAVKGRGDSCLVTQGSTNGRLYDFTVDATGGAGATFNTCFNGQTCKNVIVVNMRTTGFPTYSGAFGMSAACKFVDCHSEGTSGAFAWSLGTCSNSWILGCYAENSSHEAFQLTDCLSCIMALNNGFWDNAHGQDAGLSVHGKVSISRLNLSSFNSLTNSYAAGLMAADNAMYNTFSHNTLKDCGVRGTAGGSGGTNACAMGQYTALNSQQCGSNRFIENICLSESGTTTYGFAEFVGGTGSIIFNTTLRHNEFPGAFTTRYLAPSASRRTWDVDALAFTPIIGVAGGGGSITASTLNSASFRRSGDYIDMSVDLSITSVSGTITGLLLTWATAAPLPALYQGSFSGLDITSAKMVGGVPSGSGVAIRYYDGTNPVVAGARIVVEGRYRVA
ncbi:hypothetical protein [Pseudomonas lactucae]|uniref:Uncharacterized protein n=1 Tax=Pseudomonas lactucae TaxID=2813360 RepID=A0A9X0YCS1_9PSED|nr:hypothetical protein [Pseudomonas lactucae]MBN2976929.1 hypothetical protein [Pseudomonas lactucae]MBN2988454.1 hypothetical protein [Pseudomonas lactucae]